MRSPNERRTFSCILAAVLCMVLPGARIATASEVVEDPDEGLLYVTEDFGIVLESVGLSASICPCDGNEPATWTTPERTLTFSLRFDMVDDTKPVAVNVEPPTILGLWDADGLPVNVQASDSEGDRFYEEVRWASVTENRRSVMKLLPSGLVFDLVLDSNQPTPAFLSRIEGYGYALYAEEVVEADVPFELSGQYIDAARGFDISVCPTMPPTPGPIEFEAIPGATSRANGLRPTAPLALWIYETCVHSTTGSPVFGLGATWYDGASPGDHVVVKTQLLEGQWTRNISQQRVSADTAGNCICEGQVEQSYDDYDTIRHVIAVHPVEVKIPFVLENIPMPSLSSMGR